MGSIFQYGASLPHAPFMARRAAWEPPVAILQRSTANRLTEPKPMRSAVSSLRVARKSHYHCRGAAAGQRTRPLTGGGPAAQEGPTHMVRFAGNAGSETWPFWLELAVRAPLQAQWSLRA